MTIMRPFAPPDETQHGVTQVFLQPRGGGGKSWLLPYATCSWGRVLNETSSAAVSIGEEGLADESGCAALACAEQWADEILIVRDGIEVWLGPLLSIDWDAESANLLANDNFIWFERRLSTLDRVWTDIDVGVIFEAVALNALEKNNSMNIVLDSVRSDVKVSREVKSADRTRAADIMRDVSRSGIDFTVIGRRVLTGVKGINGPHLGVLTEATLTNPQASSNAQDVATHVVVRGFQGEGETPVPVVGEAVENGFAGAWLEVTLDEPLALDAASANTLGRNHLALVRRPALTITATLHSESPIGVEALIPGYQARINMDIGCRHVDQEMRLRRVDCAVGADGAEAVTVEFGPLETVEG